MAISLFFVSGFAAFLLLLALLLAWALGIALFYPGGALAGRLVNRQDIIRAHIDYLMMAQFLFLFFVAFKQFAISPPAPLVVCMCVGAFFNPFAFVMRGLSAPPAAPPPPGIPLPALVSFSATTIGFLGAALLIVQAAWRAL
jgi:hypothetical protein